VGPSLSDYQAFAGRDVSESRGKDLAELQFDELKSFSSLGPTISSRR
jgi:hypothetical protein